MKNPGFIVLGIYIVYLIVASIRYVLIGHGKIIHPMYDTEEKRLHIRKKGIIGIVGAIIGILIIAFSTL